MRLKVSFWLALALAVFGTLLSAAPSVLKAANLNWPAWQVALAGAAATALAGLAGPVTKVLTQSWADRTKSKIQQEETVHRIEREAGRQGKGLELVRDVIDPGRLGIHKSIPLPPDADNKLDKKLPEYIYRDIDDDLRVWVRDHKEQGGFLLLVGLAASGKTRCAHKLINDMLGDWHIFIPDTAARMTEYFEADPPADKLVVWLNETQKFLGPDGLSATTIHRALSRRQPVIIVGTIWPSHYDSLTGTTTTGISGSQTEAKDILQGIADRRTLRRDFTPKERKRAEAIGTSDPRIAKVTRTNNLRFAETLAVGQELIDRWQTAANPYGGTVITAAVTARRCGHPEPLPASVLKPLTAALLTPTERGTAKSPSNWFEDAINWAKVLVLETSAPLTPSSSKVVGISDGFSVSDILVQQAISEDPEYTIISKKIWMLLIDNSSPEACTQVGSTAQRRRVAEYLTIAEAAFQRAAEKGYAPAMSLLGDLLELEDEGRTDEAERWYRKAVDKGYPAAMYALGFLLDRKPDKNDSEIEELYRKAAEDGYMLAAFALGMRLGERHEDAEAAMWLRMAADNGLTSGDEPEEDPTSGFILGALLAEHGEDAEAIRRLTAIADSSDTEDPSVPWAKFNLGVIYSRQGDDTAAEIWYRKAAQDGNGSAMHNLAIILEERNEDTEAEEWYRKSCSVKSYSGTAAFDLANFMSKHGRHEEALDWYEKAATNDNDAAVFAIGLSLDRQGGGHESREWFIQALTKVQEKMIRGYSSQIAKFGGPAEFKSSALQAAEKGNPAGMFAVATMLIMLGNVAEAEQWYRRSADSGYYMGMLVYGILLGSRGDNSQAASWFDSISKEKNPENIFNPMLRN